MAHEPMLDLRDFHNAFGQARFIELSEDDREDLISLRTGLIAEEFCEVAEALGYDYSLEVMVGERQNLHALAKELADLLYVVYGTAEILDIPLEQVFAEVHANNMSKLGPDGKPILREDGKFLKPEGYQPVDVLSLF